MDTNINLDNTNFQNINNFHIEEIVQNIAKEVNREKNDPFLTPYYFKFIEQLRQFQEIVIVGAGFYGRNLYKILEQNDIHTVKCFADNGYRRYKNGVYGKKVLSLQDATEKQSCAYFVVTPRFYYMELIRQLLNLGVNADRVDCFIVSDTGLEI